MFRCRQDLILENLALRQQLLALHTSAHAVGSPSAQAVLDCPAKTVVGMERPTRSRHTENGSGLAAGRLSENPTWGAPRIHGELLKLGFKVSEPTVSRWLQRLPRSPDVGGSWLTFLRNHRAAIAAMDFFTVPTLTFGVLYCFFVIGHDRRKILRFNVPRNPTAFWMVQQMREAWPYSAAQGSCCLTATRSSATT